VISLFLLPMVASALAAGSLSLIGRHLILRRVGFYLLPLHQLCVFVAIILATLSLEGSALRFMAAVLSSVLFAMFLRSSWVRSEHGLLVIYLVLMAVNFLMMRLNPSLEFSFSQTLFGDIALLSQDLSILLILGSVASLALLTIFHRRLFRESFQSALHGNTARDQTFPVAELGLGLFVSFCLLEVGFLFSSAALILAPLMVSSTFLTWKWMSVGSFLCATAGTFAGFWLSTQSEQVAASPAAVVSISLFSAAVALLRKILFRC
jgi:ABC-type Mn2+/Zn2+ transport system permease subunit